MHVIKSYVCNSSRNIQCLSNRSDSLSYCKIRESSSETRQRMHGFSRALYLSLQELYQIIKQICQQYIHEIVGPKANFLFCIPRFLQANHY